MKEAGYTVGTVPADGNALMRCTDGRSDQCGSAMGEKSAKSLSR